MKQESADKRRIPEPAGKSVTGNYSGLDDETAKLLWEPIIRRIDDGDLTAELIYVQRELSDDPMRNGEPR
jgi:hypothetical protein